MFIQALIATTFISLVSVIAGLFLIKNSATNKSRQNLLISFAAGVMLAVSFLDLLSESIEQSSVHLGLQWGLIGIVLFFILGKFLHHLHCHHEHKHIRPRSTKVLIGDGLHNFFDGVAIAAAFTINPITGWITTIAIAAHELPQEIADLSVLIQEGINPKKALLANLASGATAILGVIFGFFALSQVQELQPVLLSLSAGMFIYIALADLVPELHQAEHKDPQTTKQVLSFLIGLILTGAVVSTSHQYISHGHNHSEELHEEHMQDPDHVHDEEHHQEDHEHHDEHDHEEDH